MASGKYRYVNKYLSAKTAPTVVLRPANVAYKRGRPISWGNSASIIVIPVQVWYVVVSSASQSDTAGGEDWWGREFLEIP